MPRILNSLIQSDFGGDHGNFEAVIQEDDQLVHYGRDNSDPELPWHRFKVIVPQGVTGAGSIIQSDFRSPDGHGNFHGNFEVVVPIGSSLIHFWHDNSDMTLPWQRGQTITEVAGWGCIMQSNFGTREHGNFEVLAEEGTKTVVHYWYLNHDILDILLPPGPCRDLTVPWMRERQQHVLVGEPNPTRVASARKWVQLTGEYDLENWDGLGPKRPTFNRTESQFGIRGTDLGASFEHKNRVYFLFGDTWRVNQTLAELNLDSIAYCTDTDPRAAGLHLTFNSKPPLFPPSDNIDQRGFNVPLDGVSWNGAMYVFFSTCHYNVDGNDVMGRSVLGRSDNDGSDFVYIGEFSRRKFINVSIERGTIDEAAAEITHFAAGTPVLWIWGSGRYRASPIYLAVMPLAGIEALLWPVRYFAGGTPWSSNEDDAVPLFGAGDVGELSVRWNPFLARWLALFNSGNPRGILMHSAPQPWGPWSKDPVMIFDPVDGYGRFIGQNVFMHVPGKHTKDPNDAAERDYNFDNMFKAPDGSFPPRKDEWGGEYGPYQITRYASGKHGESSQIWFTMSTWNPYQVMLMTSTITANMI